VRDVGTSVRNILFNILLSEDRPLHIVIIDAMDVGREPGELFRPDLDAIPETKTDDFSMHQIPTSNLLRELRDLCGVTIAILACQVAHIPEGVSPGLSRPVSEAVPRAVALLARDHGVRLSPPAARTR
jgi:coenzyme F420 hydrogenase subunit delta